MKIAFSTYPRAFKFQGGGEVILSKIKEYLTASGNEVRIFTEWDDPIKEYQLLHNFSVVKHCLPVLQQARKEGMKIALHPIYWPQTEYAVKGDFTPAERVRKFAYSVLASFSLAGSHVRKILGLADILFPNSHIEAELLCKEFNLPLDKMHVVHDGVDARFFTATPDKFIQTYQEKEFVLYVGRIEPRKNVLGLIRAMHDSPLKLIIIGDADRANESYFQKCREAAGDNTRFLGRVPHESDLLPSAYAAAKVLALPSWYETPGIVALEAAAAGSNIVITDRGCTKEYFQEHAEYVDPLDRKGIRDAIERAFSRPRNEALKAHIQKHYTWEKVAEETLAGYRKLLAGETPIRSKQPGFSAKV